MTPFKQTTFHPSELVKLEARLKRAGISKETIDKIVQERKVATIYRNDKYQVELRHEPEVVKDGIARWPAMISLSIKLITKDPIHDWRELQEIKNQLVGKENEAVELYPAESRLMDTANQYFLWALKNPEERFPFGFTQRVVSTTEEASKMGAKQRQRSV